MINVTSYGATGDWNGSTGTDNRGPIESAIAAANAAGDEIYFPPGKYWVLKSVDKSSLSNLRFYGKGAVIICQGTTASTNNGIGGGFYLAGNNLIVEDLQFEGFSASLGSTTNGTGRLLMLVGSSCVVNNCNFTNGNGGAIEITGSYNIINGNTFNCCNNYPSSNSNYGAIMITGTSQYNTISENKIYGQFYAGICANGTGVSYLDILNNYIRSNSSSSSTGHSRGVYLLLGANQKIKIIANTIETIDSEGILITSDSTYLSNECIVSNNTIRDCDFRGISLQNISSGSFTDFIINGNIIENTTNAQDYAHQIWLDTLSDSIIANNKCIGYSSGVSGQGLAFYNSCPRNQVSDNLFRTLSYGIVFYSPDGALKDNHVYNCVTGIQIGNCKGASIVGNLIKSCTTGVYYTTDSSPLHILGNAILDCTNRYGYGASLSVVPEIMSHSGRASGGNYDSFVVTGTLSGGSPSYVVVTFNKVYTGDRFIVVPNNESGDTQGAIYVSLIDVTNSQVTVRSTLSGDSRSFTLIKVISGG